MWALLVAAMSGKNGQPYANGVSALATKISLMSKGKTKQFLASCFTKSVTFTSTSDEGACLKQLHSELNVSPAEAFIII